MVIELTTSFWYIITPFLLINIFTLAGFYYTTKAKQRFYDQTFKDLKISISELNKKIDCLTLQLLKK